MRRQLSSYILVAVALVFSILFASTDAQGCASLQGPSSTGYVQWTKQTDSVDFTVQFPKESLDVGWVALGITNTLTFGMDGADILFLYKDSSSNVKAVQKKAQFTSKPAAAVGDRFETSSVRTSVQNGKLIVQFSRKITYAATDAVQLIDGDQALLVAMNTATTPTDDDNFLIHDWKQKQTVNFLTATPMNNCAGIIPVESSSPPDVQDTFFDQSFIPEPSTPIEPRETNTASPVIILQVVLVALIAAAINFMFIHKQ